MCPPGVSWLLVLASRSNPLHDFSSHNPVTTVSKDALPHLLLLFLSIQAVFRSTDISPSKLSPIVDFTEILTEDPISGI